MLTRLSRRPADSRLVVLLDLMLGDEDGVEVARVAKRLVPRAGVVVLTGMTDQAH